MKQHPLAPNPPGWAAVARHDSPLGLIWLATHQTQPTALAGLWFDHQKHAPQGLLEAEAKQRREHTPAVLDAARQQLDEYFAGQRQRFELTLAPWGSVFQQRVWQALQAIPFGGLNSYGEIARRLGLPQGARAVGTAVGRNPVSIVIPCHRVLGRHGALTGYAGGVERKIALLRLEGSM
jgi:methylated-DNA-[protein]-cysteine S-methyltransferase